MTFPSDSPLITDLHDHFLVPFGIAYIEHNLLMDPQAPVRLPDGNDYVLCDEPIDQHTFRATTRHGTISLGTTTYN